MLMLHRSERGWDPLEGGRLRSERPRLVAVLLTLILDHARRAETHDVNQVVRTRPVTADTALSGGALRMALGIDHRPRPGRALGRPRLRVLHRCECANTQPTNVLHRSVNTQPTNKHSTYKCTYK